MKVETNIPRKGMFKQTPLIEAVLEIRFPTELSIEGEKDKYYREIRKEYPKVYVPYQAREPYALIPYQFRSEDGKNIIGFSINRFSIHTHDYKGFVNFKPQCLKYVSLFCKLYGIKNLTRIGLRYINHIPFLREKNKIPMSRYVKIKLSVPNLESDKCDSIQIFFQTEWGKNGKCRISVGNEELRDSQKTETILLDFDYFLERNLVSSKLSIYLEEAHKHIRKMFLDMLTEEYKDFMKKGEGKCI